MSNDKSVDAQRHTTAEQDESGRARQAQNGGPTEHRQVKRQAGDKPVSQGQSKPL